MTRLLIVAGILIVVGLFLIPEKREPIPMIEGPNMSIGSAAELTYAELDEQSN